MLVMTSASDLMTLYLGFELQSLALYICAALARDNLRSTEAGLKYFVLGALASGLLIYGISLVYGFAGTTNYAGLAAALSNGAGYGTVIGIVFVLVGLAFKISAAPFHMWTPDVYEGAPAPVTALFSTAPKVAAMALLLGVMLGPFGHLLAQWQLLIVILSVASMLLGSLAAIGQSNIKRLMAYSSIGHMGYALIGLAAGGAAGVQATLIYLAIYVAMSFGVFACVIAMRRQGRPVEAIGDLAGLSSQRPGFALALAVLMFAMAGIPPLSGFFGKLYVFAAAVHAGLDTLAVIGVLTSVVGAFYYLRIIKVMYFDVGDPGFDRAAAGVRFVMAVGAVASGLFVFLPGPVIAAANAAARALCSGEHHGDERLAAGALRDARLHLRSVPGAGGGKEKRPGWRCWRRRRRPGAAAGGGTGWRRRATSIYPCCCGRARRRRRRGCSRCWPGWRWPRRCKDFCLRPRGRC